MKKIKIAYILLYGFFITGAIFNALDLFQQVVSYFAGPLLIVIGSIAAYLLIKEDRRSIGWLIFVAVGSYAIEFIGTRTGILFGEYEYGPVLIPQILHVPLAIPFAWIFVLTASYSIMLYLGVDKKTDNALVQAFIIATLMTVYDAIMEPAAIRLNYWTWADPIPLKNYFTWFVAGFIFAYTGLRFKVTGKFAEILLHLYIITLLYFSISIL